MLYLCRWLNDQHLDLALIPRCRRMEEVLDSREITNPPIPLARALRSNPLDNSDPNTSPPAHNPTVGMRHVYHVANAALRDTLVGIETQDDMTAYMERFEAFSQNIRRERENTERIIDPPVIRHRGRPRDKRLTAASEGVVQGGGGSRGVKRTRTRAGLASMQPGRMQTRNSGIAPREGLRTRTHGEDLVAVEPSGHRRCGRCNKFGHNIRTCPSRK